MRIHVARAAGFCFGVRRAIQMATNTAQTDQEVRMLGAIVHNEHVVRKIRESGIETLQDLGEMKSGTLLLRAHGATPEIYRQAQRQGLKIVDATCPLVKEIHEAACRLEKEGYQVVVIGDHGHDEVVGIAGQVREAVVFSSPEEVVSHPRSLKKIGVIVQSTQDMDRVKSILAELAARCRELKFLNTICKPTSDHQQEIRQMPKNNDVMIIVGSFTSANTTRLTQIAAALNPRTHQVQSAEELRPEWFEEARDIGVSAGASTPDWILEEVIHRITEMTGGERSPD